MLTETQLKEKLQVYAENEFRPPAQEELSELVPAMLYHIGSTDSVLRDDLIYSAFATWITDHDAIEHEQLRNMLPIVLDEVHLLYKVGEQDTDSVFTRAFSVLLLPLLLITQRAHPFLSPSEIYQVKEKLLYYLRNEKDRRGFVDGKGWAHATAHGADALDDLAQCPEMNKADLADMLDVVYDMVCEKDMGYVCLEDERIVTAVLAILKRQLLSDAEVTQWIQGFADRVLPVKSPPQRHIIRGNVKSFLQSLYFRLQWEQASNKFEAEIDQTLQRINPFRPRKSN
ncbi:MAG TPA: DUF2785 domain-containing protein [Anaerolineales bacterium]|nr:DUF2785 domain-containing protein [Anaerolineales bacterium]